QQRNDHIRTDKYESGGQAHSQAVDHCGTDRQGRAHPQDQAENGVFPENPVCKDLPPFHPSPSPLSPSASVPSRPSAGAKKLSATARAWLIPLTTARQEMVALVMASTLPPSRTKAGGFSNPLSRIAACCRKSSFLIFAPRPGVSEWLRILTPATFPPAVTPTIILILPPYPRGSTFTTTPAGPLLT